MEVVRISEILLPIYVEKLTQVFYPEKRVLDNINLKIVEGETIGILGNNGSGKTTLLRILATLLYPSYGVVEIFGMDPRVEATEIKPFIGYLPERFSFYPYFSVNEIIEFFERLTPKERTDQEALREEIIQLLKIESYLDERINSLSKGMLHKVGLAITLIHDPPLLLMDEPTSGLDPLVRVQLRKILKKLTLDFEKTVVISSHIIEDVEAVCDRVFFLERGQILQKPLWISELQTKFSQLRKLEFKHEKRINLIELSENAEILHYEADPQGTEIYCNKTHESSIKNMFSEALGSNIDCTINEVTLEDIYILNHAKVNWIEAI